MEYVERDRNAIELSGPSDWGGTLMQLSLSCYATNQGKRWGDRWVRQEELLGNKYIYIYPFLNAQSLSVKRSLGLGFIKTETLLSSFWALGNEWHSGSGHSQLSREGATFSRWKLWLKTINNKCFWAACVFPGLVREGTRVLSLPQMQQAQVLENLKTRLLAKILRP